MSAVHSSAPLCWLHISDLHVQSASWEQDIVLKAMLRDLPGLLTSKCRVCSVPEGENRHLVVRGLKQLGQL